MAYIATTKNFIWKGSKLHYFGKGDPVATIEPDSKWPGMFRFRLPGGKLSDMANITWAKESAILAARERFSEGKQQADSRPPVSYSESPPPCIGHAASALTTPTPTRPARGDFS